VLGEVGSIKDDGNAFPEKPLYKEVTDLEEAPALGSTITR